MARRKNNFLEQLERRRQEAAAPAPAEKPVSEMSEEELDAEEARLRGELRALKERELAEMREEASSGNRWAFPRRRKRPWK
jgi:hypothetical protein